jgi:hypothetical protein
VTAIHMVPSSAADEATLNSCAEANIMTRLATIVTYNILEFWIQNRARTTSHNQLSIAPTLVTTRLDSFRCMSFLTLLFILTTSRALLLRRIPADTTAQAILRLRNIRSKTLRQHHRRRGD